MSKNNLLAFRVVRFALVGLVNTAVNFAILNLSFYELRQSKLVSSFIATSCALIFSFILSRSFVFADKDQPAKKMLLFIVVTVSGILLTQNSIYALGLHFLHNHEVGVIIFVHRLLNLNLSRNFIDVNLSNIIASLFVMVWNYNGYRLLVFKSARLGNGDIKTT